MQAEHRGVAFRHKLHGIGEYLIVSTASVTSPRKRRIAMPCRNP